MKQCNQYIGMIFFTSTRNPAHVSSPISIPNFETLNPKSTNRPNSCYSSSLQLISPDFSTPMDFRFRAIDNKPPAAASSSDQPPQDDSTNSELVKQRIKEEIVIREIASRRLLEAEIRRELILEQELAMLRATGLTQGLAFHEPSATRLLDQRLNHIVDQPPRGLLAPEISGSRFFQKSLPVRTVLEPQKEELKPLDDEKKKCFILTKPDPEIFEAKKRKVEGPPKVADGQSQTVPIQSSKKSANDKFICKTCNITTTSEITFKTHLEGKKHKNKEGRTLQTRVVLNPLPSPAEKGKAPEQPALQNKGGFKFWCQMCQKGSNSIVIMDTHYLGKKHMARLLKLGEGSLEDQMEPQGLDSGVSSPEENDEATDLIA